MSRLAEWKAEQKKKQEEVVRKDRQRYEAADKEKRKGQRSVASATWDTVNLFDSGRSATTKDPSKEGKKDSTTEQAKKLAGFLFETTAKAANTTAETGRGAVDTGRKIVADATENEKASKAANDRILDDQYSEKGEGLFGVGGLTTAKKTANQSFKDQARIAAGTGLGIVGELMPVGSGVKAGKVLKKSAESGSKMARAKAAGRAGAEGSIVGASGGAGSTLTKDDASLFDIATQALASGVTGGVLGAGSTAIPFRRPLDERGHIKPYTAKMSDGLKNLADSGRIDGNITNADASTLRMSKSNDALDDLTTQEYVNQIKQGAELDPIIVKRGANGEDVIVDGDHRFAAAQQLGIRVIPVVRQKDNIALPDKVAPPNPQSLAEVAPANSVSISPLARTQPNALYHGSTFDKAMSVLNDGKLRASSPNSKQFYSDDVLDLLDSKKGGAELEPPSVSFSRQRNAGVLNNQSQDIKFVFDEPTLTKKVGKTKPYADKGFERSDPYTEAEQRIGKDVPLESLRHIELGPLLEPDQRAAIKALAKEKNIQVFDVQDDVPIVQLKVLEDLQTEANVRSPGDDTVSPSQANQTKTQQGAGAIAADIEATNDKWSLGLESVNTKALNAIQGTSERTRGRWAKVKDDAAENFQDARSVMSRTLGKLGDDLVYDLEAGKKYKRDALASVDPFVTELSKIAKNHFKTTDARIIAGKRIGEAIEDPSKVAALSAPEQKAYEQFKGVWDFVMTQRKAQGLEVVEDGYRPHVRMRDAASEPTYLEAAVRKQAYDTKSRYSKERVSDSVDGIDTNIFDMLPGYLNSQFNELGYDAAVRKFVSNSVNLPSAYRADRELLKQGTDFAADLVRREITPPRKSGAERVVDKRLNTVYSSVLRGNVRVAAMNYPQRLLANARVTKQAVKARSQLARSDVDDLMKDLHYGDYSIHGQFEDAGDATLRKSKATKTLDKIDPEYRSEKGNVKHSFFDGVAQAVIDSAPYKAAKKSGLSTQEAMSAALKDPEVRTLAVRKGNTVVADTQLGASSLNKPRILKQEGFIGVVPIPKKIFTMFTRFPIGMSNEIITTLGMKDKRALEFIKYGDPRQAGIAEMRHSYGVLQDVLKDKLKAIDDGVDVGIPKSVLSEQVKVIGSNLKAIDKIIKKESNSRGGKNLKALGELWAAATGIQILLDAGIQSFMEDPAGTTLEAAGKTNPSVVSTLFGRYSPLAGLSSASLPAKVSPSGELGVNTRAITNYVPGVGVAVNRGRDIKKLSESLFGSNEEE